MDLTGVVGIWGYGIGGKALVDFLSEQSQQLMVFDKRSLLADEILSLQQKNILVADSLERFLSEADIIIPSAGVDLTSYQSVAYKFVSELDFFQAHFKKPIIAITGTLGKTTITTCLAELLKRAGKRVAIGGNIGIGLGSLIQQQELFDCAVLEVSSFQLEHIKSFAPSVALWTNFYPNHLDRHPTITDYFNAKAMIARYQDETALTIADRDIIEKIKSSSTFEHSWYELPLSMPEQWQKLVEKQSGLSDNWRILCSVIDALKLPWEILNEPLSCMLEHRMEYVATINERIFYNDSKATVAQSTLAAVKQLEGKNIILLLNGLGKGVSREPLIKEIRSLVKQIVVCGAEAEQLELWSLANKVPVKRCSSFEESVEMAYNCSIAGDVVLLSPAGSSFDLFKNYQERGKKFKELVSELKGQK